MFHRYGKKVKSNQTKPLKDLTRVMPAEQLLAEEKRDQLMQQIKALSALDEARFDSLCLSLTHYFINHCQSLPETSTSYYSQQGGLLDHALNRTEAALDLFQQYLSLDTQEEAQLSEEQKLWQYALFSAAILQGIGKLFIDYKIRLYDKSGEFLKQWNPLLESLASVGSHYSYEFLSEPDPEFRCRLNLLLARFLMPSSGYAWIASNPQVLVVWLALLNEDMNAAGTLGAILVRANAIAIQRYFKQFMGRGYGSGGGGKRYGRVTTFSGGIPETVAEKEQQIGIEFIQWLTKALDAGRIMINKAPLFMVPGGMILSPPTEIIREFMSQNPEYKNWQAVQNGILSIGLHQLGADGSIYSRFEQNSNQQMHTGILFTDYAVFLPPEVSLSLPTGEKVVISAIELINQAQANANLFTAQKVSRSPQALLHLNAAGEWEAPSAARPQNAAMHRGITNGA